MHRGGKLYGRTGTYRNENHSFDDGFVIGRGELCDLKLSDSSVSRRHTQFRFAQGSWYVHLDWVAAGALMLCAPEPMLSSLRLETQFLSAMTHSPLSESQ